MKTYPYIITGLGNIGRNLLAILHERDDLLAHHYGFRMRCVGVADSSGVAYDAAGLDAAAIVQLKQQGGYLRSLPTFQTNWSPIDLAAQGEYDFLLESTPTNLVDGQPGLDIVRAALNRGRHAVLASKGPLVLAYRELAALSDLQPAGSNRQDGGSREQIVPPALRFSGAVGGGLPSINIGWRDLAGTQISKAELVVNGTTQVILEEMASGKTFDEALAEAQRQGIVEPDPSLDVDGWDAANKLVIFANAVLRQPTTLADLSVSGIRDVGRDTLQQAWAAGGRISLVGLAELTAEGRYRLSVQPTILGPEHPLARLAKGEMGIVYHSDIVGRTTATSLEDGPIGSCAAMVRDIIEIVGREQLQGLA
jgi:homoserine dehydrogenase